MIFQRKHKKVLKYKPEIKIELGSAIIEWILEDHRVVTTKIYGAFSQRIDEDLKYVSKLSIITGKEVALNDLFNSYERRIFVDDSINTTSVYYGKAIEGRIKSFEFYSISYKEPYYE